VEYVLVEDDPFEFVFERVVILFTIFRVPVILVLAEHVLQGESYHEIGLDH